MDSATNSYGEVTIKAALRLVSNFLADRANGSRAQQCLTPSALVSFEGAANLSLDASTASDVELGQTLSCLFSCEDGLSPTFDVEPTLQDHGYEGFTREVTTVLIRSEDGGVQRRVRETYALTVTTGPDQPKQVLIKSVRAEPESYVGFERAAEHLRGFLDALAQARFDEACCLFNEGVSTEVEEKLGDVWTQPLDRLLSEYCQRAYCDAPYEIIGSGEVRILGRQLLVRFSTPHGEIEQPIWIGMFEGSLSIGDLPPEKP